MRHYKSEQLPIFNTHPVIAYFGMDTIQEVLSWYITTHATIENAALIEDSLLNMVMNDHDGFFNMVEDYLAR